jgi:hypothetical protein
MAATLGGSGFGVSRSSLHPREAAMLVRFLCSREEQVRRCRNTADAPSISQLYDASHAYWEAVHAVLTRKKSAAQSAAELQNVLSGMLGKHAARADVGREQQIAPQR